MEHNLKNLIAHLSPRDTRELVEDHVKRIDLNTAARSVTLYVDKRYAFNAITSHDQIGQVIKCVRKAFGEDFSAIIALESPNSSADRERAVPHAIHYS